MPPTLKTAVFLAARYLGAFRLARALTADRLRILCYHGISIRDEHLFRGRLFMSPKTFEARMRLLKEKGYCVLPLADAIHALRSGGLPKDAVVITFDDGWYGIGRYALPVLHACQYPITLYVTTYYAEKETQVFNVALQYLFWKTQVPRLALSSIDHALTGDFDLSDQGAKERALKTILDHGEQHCAAPERQALLEKTGAALGIDGRALAEEGCFRLMNFEQLSAAAQAGIDLQLHTHRHSFHGLSQPELTREIEENRALLTPLATQPPLSHLCYPSGQYQRDTFPALHGLGIETATTCLTGLNTADTHPFELRRILDEEALSSLEIEAELSGFLELLRHPQSVAKRFRRKTAA